MTKLINIQIDDSFALYEVNHDRNGIYLAKLIKKSYHFIYDFPEKLILLKTGTIWACDHHHQEIGLLIGRKFDEESNRKEE